MEVLSEPEAHCMDVFIDTIYMKEQLQFIVEPTTMLHHPGESGQKDSLQPPLNCLDITFNTFTIVPAITPKPIMEQKLLPIADLHTHSFGTDTLRDRNNLEPILFGILVLVSVGLAALS